MRRIGENVRFYRNLRGLTQTALARLVQVAPAYVSQIEANQRIPSLKVTRRIAEELELDLSVLLRESDPRIAEGRLSSSEKLDLLRTLMLSIESEPDPSRPEVREFRSSIVDITELASEPAFCVVLRTFHDTVWFGRETADSDLECHVILEGRALQEETSGGEHAVLEVGGLASLEKSRRGRLRAEEGTRVLSIYGPRLHLDVLASLTSSGKLAQE